MQPEMSDLDAFRIFTRIMDESVTTGGKRFALRSLFTPDMPGLHLLLHQLEGLVRTYLPALYARLQLLGITASTYFEQKQISSTSMLEIQTLRAKVDFVTMQNEALYQDNVNLKATLSKVNKERISDVAEIQRQCEVKIASAMAVAELEKKKRVELEKELKLLKQKMSKAEILGDSW
ncbi:hypothetical protein HDU99_003435 [Rhizoclosmatium hyalinum]|nr:hypothetical protein HDU99_003435 [Rhizoclosmatium hyalinum]